MTTGAENDRAGQAGALERIRERFPEADPLSLIPDVDLTRIPRHVAMIMDGNGRWAQKQGLERLKGHQEGAKVVRKMLKTCAALGVEVLTLYSFSTENWNRPAEEVQGLMEMCVAYCEHEREALIENNVRVRVLGSREGLSSEVLGALDALVEATSTCGGITLCLAINYGARAEIVNATRALAQRVVDGEIGVDEIDEQRVSDALTTRGLPDPDLLVRTGGEMRLSNYLLWQLSYAELMVTGTHWPDFTQDELCEMIRAFTLRQRRFGHTCEPVR